MTTYDSFILCITLLGAFFACLMLFSSLASKRTNLFSAYNHKKKMEEQMELMDEEDEEGEERASDVLEVG